MIISVIGGVIILVRLGHLFLEPVLTEEELFGELRISLIALGASLGVPFVVWRALISSVNVKISERSHHSDIYFRAIERLSETREGRRLAKDGARNAQDAQEGAHEKEPALEVRVGAIYSLQILLGLSAEAYLPIIQTLSTYAELNEDAPGEYLSSEEHDKLQELIRRGASEEFNLEYVRILQNGALPKQFLTRPRADLRAAYEVLCAKSPPDNVYSVKHIRPVLSRRNLQYVNFQGARLPYVSMQYAIADRSDFRHADLSYANLYCARLNFARLRGVRLRGANVAGTTFALADIRGYRDKFQIELELAFGDAWTILPDGISRPGHWTSTTRDWRELHDIYGDWVAKQGRRLLTRY